MNRGVVTSVSALLLCWVPVLGVLLAAIGFIGVMRCITERYKTRFVLSLIAVTLILVLCVGVLTAEVYAYSRDPDIVQNTGEWLLEALTGESIGGDEFGDTGDDFYYGDEFGAGDDSYYNEGLDTGMGLG